MSYAHVAPDHVFVPILIAWSVIDWLWIYPRFVRAIAAGVPGARKRLYWSILVMEWALTGGVLGLWVWQRRAWGGLFLGPTTGVRFVASVSLVVAFLVVLWSQRRAILRRPKLMEVVRRKIAHGEPLLPHKRDERAMFAVLSVTAGVCEEILFRGFVVWYFAGWTGPIVALGISSVIFGFGHIYQGTAQVPKTGALGAVLGVIVLLTGSLWPAIILHAAIDMNSGDLGYRAFGEGRAAATDPDVR